MILSSTEPKMVMKFFEEICAVPHGSGNTRLISDYLVNFAEERGLEYTRDELNNVIIFAPGTEGYEKSAPVIMQGHTDMVCEKLHDGDINFEKDGLSLIIDGDFVTADGTTLGADDGIALAYTLAVLDSTDIPHPPIEAVFTVDEETGMTGANGIDVSRLKGRTMLNIDSEQEGVFTVSCAGGANAFCEIPMTRTDMRGYMYKLSIDGLKGGHSGMEIGVGRGNSNILMGRLLYALGDIGIMSLSGGTKGNAIPLRTDAVIIADKDISELVSRIEIDLKNELRASDPDVFISCTAMGEHTAKCVGGELGRCLMCAPNGVYDYSREIEGLVQTSLNLGIAELKEDRFTMLYTVRSSVGSQKQWLLEKLGAFAESFGGNISVSGGYAEWEYKEHSPLRELMCEVYRRQYGSEPVIEAIHAGVECGIFAGKLPGLDCVSFGPNLLDIHTVNERMNIPSVQRTWKFIKEVLRRMQ